MRHASHVMAMAAAMLASSSNPLVEALNIQQPIKPEVKKRLTKAEKKRARKVAQRLRRQEKL